MYRLESNAPITHSRWPSRICFLLGIVLLIANILLTYLPGMDTLYVHYWVYIVLMIMPIVCFIGAIGFAIFQRFTTRTASRVSLIVTIALLAIGAIFTFSLSSTMAMVGDHPVAYYSSPEGTNRFVVMKSMRDETNYSYTIYPMTGKYFYLATAGQSLDTNSGIDTVTWDSEDVAQVVMLDEQQNEVQFTVDFNNPYVNPLYVEESPLPADEQPKEE